MCKTNHFENSIQERACYNYGRVRHLKKNCPVVGGSQGLSKGNERSLVRVTPLGGAANNFWQPTNAPRPVVTQSSVQQSRTQGRAFVLTHPKAMASNTVVEGMISIS